MRKMRPSLLELLLVAACVCQCKASPDIARDGLRRRTGMASSILQTAAASTLLELLTTSSPTPTQLPASASTGLDCSTTLQIPTSTCSLSNGQQICTDTSIPIAFCKSEYLCFENDAGQDTCRPRDDKISPAGIAFAIIVPLALAIITISLILLRRRERKARERQRVIRTMERDSLGYTSNGTVLPIFERYQRVGSRGHGSMGSEAELQLSEEGEEYPPPAYTTRSFDSALSQQWVSDMGLPKTTFTDGDTGGAAERGSHEQSH